MRSSYTPDYNQGDSRAQKAALDDMRLNDPVKYENYIRQKIMAEMEAAGIKMPGSQENPIRDSALEKLTEEEKMTLQITKNLQSIMSKLSHAEQVALGLAEPKQPKQQGPRHKGKSSYMGDMSSQLKKNY